MPLYEYECARCGRFERIQKFSDPPLDPFDPEPVFVALSDFAPVSVEDPPSWELDDFEALPPPLPSPDLPPSPPPDLRA